MQERIKALVAAGEWSELSRLAETLPAGEDCARIHLALSKHLAETAVAGSDYRGALALARKACAVAAAGGLLHTWALARVASLAADLGLYQEAERAGLAFIGALPLHEQAQAIAPWAYFAVARSYAACRRHSQALAFFELAEITGTGEIAERALLHRVWTLAESGRPVRAARLLPATVEHVGEYLLDATRALVCAMSGDWASARHFASIALQLRSFGYWSTYDTVMCAELCHILKVSAERLNLPGEGAVWQKYAANILCGWNAGIFTNLLPTLPRKGGDFKDAATSRYGGAGTKRAGLIGTVG